MRLGVFDRVLVQDALETEHHIGGCHLDAVVKEDAPAQLDTQGAVVEPRDLLGQLEVNDVVGVAGD